ncbi:MAG: MerC domain-containing protein [Blastomonas sp.]|jgi:hypothetical protein|uniref:MerC domain-containing protein n=1 Tax=unclassified Blastomonas TaxID=2626550 RepID=UPI000B16DBAA|nr:MerC domain-containing protein [Blastomonas sp.]MCH2238039.1 MerC domain-containing protein [Blastomonas sp.]
MSESRRVTPSHAPKAADVAEGAAISASLLCLAHCLVLPLLLASAPALSQSLALPFDLHLWIVLLAGPVSLWILIRAAWQRRHGILLLGLCGLSLLMAALVLPVTERQEIVISSIGSLSLAFAHIANWLARHPRLLVHG